MIDERQLVRQQRRQSEERWLVAAGIALLAGVIVASFMDVWGWW